MRLVVLTDTEVDLRAAVVALSPRPAQEPFSGRARETLTWSDGRVDMTAFAIVAGGEAVGFGIIDRAELDLVALTPRPDRAALLRSFYVAADHQGHGFGRAGAAAVGPLVRALAPMVTEVVLTVNEQNAPALRAYLAAGFVDDGDRFLGGSLGPQHILRLPLPPIR